MVHDRCGEDGLEFDNPKQIDEFVIVGHRTIVFDNRVRCANDEWRPKKAFVEGHRRRPEKEVRME